jgi:hypothetical protein
MLGIKLLSLDKNEIIVIFEGTVHWNSYLYFIGGQVFRPGVSSIHVRSEATSRIPCPTEERTTEFERGVAVGRSIEAVARRAPHGQRDPGQQHGGHVLGSNGLGNLPHEAVADKINNSATT